VYASSLQWLDLEDGACIPECNSCHHSILQGRSRSPETETAQLNPDAMHCELSEIIFPQMWYPYGVAHGAVRSCPCGLQ
jgi:hypothetical protein